MRSLWSNKTIQLLYGIYVRLAFFLYSVANYWTVTTIIALQPWLRPAAREIIWRRAVKRHNAVMLAIARVRIIIDGDVPSITEPTIFISNHPSILDGFTFFSLFGPNMIPVTGPADMFAYPFNKVFRKMGVIDILRNEEDAIHFSGYTKHAAIEKMVERLKSGFNILIFPEGHLERIHQLHYLHTGAARVSISARAPIAVMALVGHERIFIDKIRMRPGTVRLCVGPLMHPPAVTADYTYGSAVLAYQKQISHAVFNLLPTRYIPEFIQHPRKHVGVFIDIDRTLYKGYSQIDWVKFLFFEGRVSFGYFCNVFFLESLELLGLVTHEKFATAALSVFRGFSVQKVERSAQKFFDTVATHRFNDIMLHMMKDHAERDHRLVLVTEVTHPLAIQFKRYLEDRFSVHGVICTELKKTHAPHGAIYTGEYVRLCQGEEKAMGIEHYARLHDIDLSRSYAYADSSTDIPMLESVGNAIAVCPKKALRKVAHARNWTILE